jgi:hypothetical protein
MPRPSGISLGQRFGKLTVQAKLPRPDHHRRVQWQCVCECGKECVAFTLGLKKGITTHCGCSHRNRQHGHAGVNRAGVQVRKSTRTYRVWRHMIGRCTVPSDKSYHRYGGRGITVCQRWLGDGGFAHFLADLGESKRGLYLERIDNARGYSPDNCRWATMKEQARNTRRNHLVTFQGRSQCLAAWAEELGFSYRVLSDRLTKLSWPVERAFTTPNRLTPG